MSPFDVPLALECAFPQGADDGLDGLGQVPSATIRGVAMRHAALCDDCDVRRSLMAHQLP